MVTRRILITGAGSGLGRSTALKLASEGHDVIATVEIPSQVEDLSREARSLDLENVTVRKLDLLDELDVSTALDLDFDILVNNSAVGEGGPLSEIPIALVRRNYEVNVFAALDLTQRVIRKWVNTAQEGKIVFVSSVTAIITPPGFGCYGSTKHAIQAIAEVLYQELRPLGIQIQTINPAAYATGFNEAMANSAFRWLDDAQNFTKRKQARLAFDRVLAMQRDAEEAVDAMVRIIPSRTGQFRNIIRENDEDFFEDLEDAVSDGPI